MKTTIITWNVNGLRAVLRRQDLGWVRSLQPDVLCLQEIKVKPHQIPTGALDGLNDYQRYWHPAERPGYSGVATFSRYQPDCVNLGIGRSEFDREGRVIHTQHAGVHLFNVYFPNSQRSLERLDFKLDFYAYLLEICDQLQAAGEQVIVCGDFNTAHQEIDLRNPKQNEANSGFLPEERAWVSKYLQHGLVDVFRHRYPAREQYTWWTYRSRARERNIGWRLDYFLVSEELLERVEQVQIHEEILGSDHCPVSITIDL
jgi:exodeoxyribonuclease-3